ncbi:hypothetical protein BC939DRAFT_476727 [Gamsiella multidivaricata]|uniref:uncharacterized protein n=1 Tax=Gamsiella multidivaricata TaxID=101098 RepID=UPI002221084A|nr:uncharacterized protein BC939DRAFT_476727 [Gamsiella multidivaricata]KAI7824305.1 hypothetical protein BC939DRAFT_476727 [Gamsiella multidivaricata]
MIFLDSLLVDRLLEVKHSSIDGISSDHKMVAVKLTLHGLTEAPSSPIKYKKPKGFRFSFRDTGKLEWTAFKEALDDLLSDKEKMRELGLKEPTEDNDTNTLEDLHKVDVERAWRWYSKNMLQCAKDTLPGKIVGRSGMKPESDLSALHLVRDLGRIKQLAKSITERRQIDLEDDARARLMEEHVKFNQHAAWWRDKMKTPMEDLEAVPGWHDAEEIWEEWVTSVDKGAERAAGGEEGGECRKNDGMD